MIRWSDANLYCYVIESRDMDEMNQQYGVAACRIYKNVWRYIDDVLGFGEVDWKMFNYGMDHKDTMELLNS